MVGKGILQILAADAFRTPVDVELVAVYEEPAEVGPVRGEPGAFGGGLARAEASLGSAADGDGAKQLADALAGHEALLAHGGRSE